MHLIVLVRQATERCGFLPLRLQSQIESRLGDTDRAIRGIREVIARNRNGSSAWDRERVVFLDNTDQGERMTVQPVTHTGTSEHAGNCVRAVERKWIQPAPCGASHGGR